jgi:hypothetical protein
MMHKLNRFFGKLPPLQWTGSYPTLMPHTLLGWE